MNRSLKLSMLLALALGSSQAAALELGQIHIRSALGQPLLAEIPVTLGSPAEGQNLSAQLASNVVFERANVSNRPNMPLLFTVTGSGNHRLIRITSSVPVNDPYLDLLIEVGSAAGKSTHEYTILLDPPGSVAQTTVPMAPPTSGSSRSRSPVAEVAGKEATPHHAAAAAPAAPARHAASGSEGKYGPVERGQTLSSIAHQAAPQGVDVNQMMLALKQANPDAFFRDNINALKTGAVLRVPSAQDAQAMAAAAALAEVRRQNGDWRANGARTPVNVADAAAHAGDKTGTPAAAAPSSGDRLALVPVQGGGKGGKGAQQEQQRSQEAQTALQQQSDELKSRVKDLEDINSKDEHLLSLKDSQIAELQGKLAAARKVAGLPSQGAGAVSVTPVPAAASTAHAVANPVKPVVAASTAAPAAAMPAKPASVAPASSTHAVATPVASKPAPVVAPVAAKPVPAKPAPVKPAPSESGAAPWYMQPWAWGAAAAALLLLVLAALRGRRKPTSRPSSTTQSTSSLADRFSDDLASGHGSSDTDQDELLDQLAEHPDDVGLHLELVSLYYSRRDVDHFEAAAEAMYAHVSHPQQEEWQEVLHMGRDLAPGHPLFTEASPPVRSSTSPVAHEDNEVHEHEALHPFDLNRYAGSEEKHELPPSPPSPRPITADQRYDFNLTQHDAYLAPTHGHDEPPAPASEPVSRWRFDEPATTEHDEQPAHDHFNDDPSDTKLDLARAYMDMGDPDGARAMLEEVLHEGSQMQRDVARRLLDELR